MSPAPREPLTSRARSRLLSVVRRGRRTVVWTPERVHLGNFLYLWLQADLRQRRGEDVRVLVTDEMRPWLHRFPTIADALVAGRDEVRLVDRRDLRMGQRWAVDFSRSDLESFARDHVLDSPVLRGVESRDAGTVVVNVRRGDFYSVPEFRRRYAFDQQAYLTAALDRTLRSGPVEAVHVVSDDVAWCRANLGWLGERVGTVTFADHEPDPERDLRDLCGARRLILTNSTFGYWGGYLSNVRHGDNHGWVVAPWFHGRLDQYAAPQLDPAWSVVEDLPGGWDSVLEPAAEESPC